MKKYYFVTFQAVVKETGNVETWNKVVEGSPIEELNEYINSSVKSGDDQYKDFVIINTLEITEEEFDNFKMIF